MTAPLSLPAHASRRSRAAARARPLTAGEKWLLAFVGVEILCQILLYLLGGTPLRLPFRIANYGVCLAMLFLVRGGNRAHPAASVIPFILGVLLIEWLHPEGDRLLAAAAQTSLYLAVLAPLVWAGRLQISWRALRIALLMFWAFFCANATMGVLQVKYPDRFAASVASNYDEESILPHVFKLADGAVIIRPTGLTDSPGGAAVGGVYTIILGMGLLLTERNVVFKGLVIAAMVGGLFCIYICQGRTNLVFVVVAAIVLVAVLVRRKMFDRVGGLVGTLAAIAFIGTTAAFATGGESVVDRFATLIADDPQTVFHDNRGKFLAEMFTETGIKYAFGAGMGRWGMMSTYFGGTKPGIWSEMMWSSLLYDGGWVLIGLYVLLLFLLMHTAWTIAVKTRHDALGCWAGVICGFNIAAIAASFVFPIFSVSLGLEVMLLNAALFATYRYESRNGLPVKTSRKRRQGVAA
jgi:hypothetical protein